MNITIVGIKDTKFANKDTGEIIEGQSVFFTYEDKNVRGEATDRCFLTRSKRLDVVPSLPCLANLYYNKFGKVEEIILCK